MGKKGHSPGALSSPTVPPQASGLAERWSAQRKMELVLRLLRSKPLEEVSRAGQVPAHELEIGSAVSSQGTRRGAPEPPGARGEGAGPGPGKDLRAHGAPGARRGPHRIKGLRGRVAGAQGTAGASDAGRGPPWGAGGGAVIMPLPCPGNRERYLGKMA